MIFFKKMWLLREFPGGPVVMTHTSIARDTDSMPDQGTKIPQDTAWPKKMWPLKIFKFNMGLTSMSHIAFPLDITTLEPSGL